MRLHACGSAIARELFRELVKISLSVSFPSRARRPSPLDCPGIRIALQRDMTSQTTDQTGRTVSTPLLLWVLQRDANAITCQLDARNDGSYEICFVPHWDPSSAVIERFETPTLAVLRHADVAKRLRENGWMVIDHVVPRGLHAAA
jgi:hypothetical protein